MRSTGIILSVIAISVSVVVCYYAFANKSANIAYIDVSKVYGDFQLTKELDAKIKVSQNSRKNILDSLNLELESLSRRLNMDTKNQQQQNVFFVKRQDYLAKEKKYMEDNENQIAMYNEQIFKQMNQYIDEYKKQNGFDFILGANGDGFIMAASERFDVTKNVIEYVNKKYKGVR